MSPIRPAAGEQRALNARLRGVIEVKDAELAALRPGFAATAESQDIQGDPAARPYVRRPRRDG